MTAIRDINKG